VRLSLPVVLATHQVERLAAVLARVDVMPRVVGPVPPMSVQDTPFVDQMAVRVNFRSLGCRGMIVAPSAGMCDRRLKCHVLRIARQQAPPVQRRQLVEQFHGALQGH
jgi:hypothetical protein